jgi:hypothetical protein
MLAYKALAVAALTRHPSPELFRRAAPPCTQMRRAYS